jgi:LysR family cys regulon transcriptional activator
VLPPIVKEFRSRYPKVNLNLHQGTSEQIADMMSSQDIDFAIATGSEDLFGNLLVIPAFQWDRKILVPNDHALTQLDTELTLEQLARYPLVSYVFSFGGESALEKAFAAQDLDFEVVFKARDADVIKTYVRMGLGVGIVASMAYQVQDRKDLVAFDAAGLFPRSTTWIGFRKNISMRGYMSDFVRLVAPHVTEAQLAMATVAQRQGDVDGIFRNVEVPLRNGTSKDLSAAA